MVAFCWHGVKVQKSRNGKPLRRKGLNGRGERIRTSDPLVPNQVR